VTRRTMHLFHVPTMMCGDCIAAITQALTDIDRSARVEADLPTRRVQVASGLFESLLRVLRQAGFPAEPVLDPLG
jgi:copper chaperone CopZ